MPPQSYREGASPIIVQPISVENPKAGGQIPLFTVPSGFFGRFRWVHWILNLDTTNVAFRWWFINVIDPSGIDYGQIIPGQAAVGGGVAPTTNPIHETLDATLPVFFDSIFDGGAGVQPEWDYSGLNSVWWPDSFRFTLDARNILPTDQFQVVNCIVELIEAETPEGLTPGQSQSLDELAYLLHTPQ